MKTTRAFLAVVVAGFASVGVSEGASSPGSGSQVKLVVESMPKPPFPYEVSQLGILQGEAEAIVSINPDGRIRDWIVTAYTHPAFERQAGEIFKFIAFKPEYLAGATGPLRAPVRIQFETSGVVISQTVSDYAMARVAQMIGIRRTEKMGTFRELDQTPTPQHTVAPLYPANTDIAPGARVLLDFIIDETGRARMPVVSDTPNQAFADAAAAALLEWRFTPPTRQGQPVIVAARQEFIFPAIP